VFPSSSVYSTSLPATNYITVSEYVATAFKTGSIPSLRRLITNNAEIGIFYNAGPKVSKKLAKPFDMIVAATPNSNGLNCLYLIGLPSLSHSHGIYAEIAEIIALVNVATDVITGPNESFINVNINNDLTSHDFIAKPKRVKNNAKLEDIAFAAFLNISGVIDSYATGLPSLSHSDTYFMLANF
jgi:hypothetical protein